MGNTGHYGCDKWMLKEIQNNADDVNGCPLIGG